MVSAILSYKKYGVTRMQVHSLLINQFHYPQDYLDTLELYFSKQWSGRYFADMMSNGVIQMEGIQYLVVYKDCHPRSVINASQVQLSFRKPMEDFNLSPYALVRILKESEGVKS